MVIGRERSRDRGGEMHRRGRHRGPVWLIAICCLPGTLVAVVADDDVRNESDGDADTKAIVDRFREERSRDPVLRTAWIDVAREGDQVVVTPLLDQENFETQQKRLVRLLESVGRKPNVMIKELVKRPVSALLQNLDYSLVAAMKFNGVQITGGYYRACREGGGTELVLEGTIGDEAHRNAVRHTCTDAMTVHPYWGKQVNKRSVNLIASYPVTSELRVVIPPLGGNMGTRLFAAGRTAYFRGEYKEAHGLLRKALVHSTLYSNNYMTAYYFIVVCEIHLDKTPYPRRACQLLKKPVRMYSNGMLKKDHLFTALRKVQGPTRFKLRDLEKSIENNGMCPKAPKPAATSGRTP